MNIKKAGATEILISNCSDCTNTVMGSAPGLGLEVHHETDHVFETVGMEVMRHLTKSKFIDGPIPEGCTASRNPEEKEKEAKAKAQVEAGGSLVAPIAPVECKGGKPVEYNDGDIHFSIEIGNDVSIRYE